MHRGVHDVARHNTAWHFAWLELADLGRVLARHRL
jgi:hypothetical protein